jgi:MFS family permease
VYELGVTWLFVLAFGLYIILLLIVRLTLNMDIQVAVEKVKQAVVKVRLPKWNSVIIWTLIVGLVGLHLAYVQWQANLSVYMSSVLQMPLWQYSILWTINGILIAIIQLSMNALNLSASRRAMFIQIFAGLLFFGIAFLILPFAQTFMMFVVAMVITTLGEATAFPMLPALVNELTPLSVKGRYQGLMAAAPNLGRAVGPLLGGVVIDYSGYHELFYAAAGVAFVAFVLVASMVMIGYRKTTTYYV